MKYIDIRLWRQFTCLLICLLPLLSGCNRSRTAVGGDSSYSKADRERYEASLKGLVSYQSLQSKVVFRMRNKSLKGTLRMVDGKRLMLAVNAPLLGFEVARVEMDHDSVWIVNKFDKTYATGTFSEMKECLGTDISLEALQCLLVGRMYLPGRGPASASDFRQFAWTSMVDGSLVGEYSQDSRYVMTYVIGDNSRLKEVSLKVPVRDVEVRWDYAGYTAVGGDFWPGSETLTAHVAGRQVKGEMTLGAPTFSIPMWSRFVPSRGYRKVSAGELMEAIKKLK